jgi:hypothetical protein
VKLRMFVSLSPLSSLRVKLEPNREPTSAGFGVIVIDKALAAPAKHTISAATTVPRRRGIRIVCSLVTKGGKNLQ